MSQKVKRKKTSHNTKKSESPFVEGSVVRIRLQNFMTYVDVELNTGPYLNLVLGPNGSGKSAIVCAIILGLGGDASLTGRAAVLHDYVRFGCKSAQVDIELHNPNESNYTITRKLVITKNKSKEECVSEWTLNGRNSSAGEVKRFIASLNIRVDNLCQFLPQERVVEFAKMNPQQLLENTEKAAGDKEMFEQHKKLVEFSKKVKGLESKRSELSKEVETESNLNDRLAEEVKRVKQRENYEKRIDLMQKKKPWLEFETVRQEYVKSKDTLKESEKKLKLCQQKHAPLRENVKITANRSKKCYDDCNKTLKLLRENRSKYFSSVKLLDKATEESMSVVTSFEGKRHEENKRQQTVEKAKEEIAVFKLKLENLVEVGDLQPQIDSLNEEITRRSRKNSTLKNEKSKYVEELESLAVEKRNSLALLRSLQNVYNEKMNLLSRMNRNAFIAACWLKENKHNFSGGVFPPIMTQINMKNKNEAKFVEKVVPMRDLFAFVFERIEDLKKFNNLLFEEKRIRVNLVMKPAKSLESFVPAVSLQRLKKYGFKKFVSDTFTAPDAVMAYLFNQFHVYEIPIGDENVDTTLVLKSEPKLTRFYTGDYYHLVFTSRYDSEKVISNEKVLDGRLLTISMDEQKLADVNAKLKNLERSVEELNNKVIMIDQKIVETENEITELRRQHKNLLLKKDEKKTILVRIERQENLIQRLESESINIESERRKACIVQLKAAAYAEKRAKDILAKADSEFNNLKRDIGILRERTDQLRREAQAKRSIAQRAVNLPNNGEIPAELKLEFDKLPDTLEELQSEIRNLHLRLESIAVNYDSNLVRDFNKRKELIRRRKEELAEFNTDIQLLKTEMESIKSIWIPPLESLINRIDDNFGRFMKRLGCAGDVILSRDKDDDFESYGISIRVKFRDNETLKTLSSIHQSGGERSVSTMIYMIALQELTKVPFRCVDEINQGMDNRNERRVFDFIVETASNNCSQYFLFSPKLLSGLEYTEKMHIHVVFNGPSCRFNRWQIL
ncbi:structural maintenance of chromosomes protein 5-like protein [Leptotrombidium deliense]|uniref:Structural maintenance of chromosomes protein 5 n=1 Tax=Leptotrombidium deliense TaxID=299467 RepID=A0A443SFM7_9ACAR|nr:structural maintenance of chromosomes protein 5-like protein [Leptotrombidium deliense]